MFTDHGKKNSVANAQRWVMPALGEKVWRLAGHSEISLEEHTHITIDFISSQKEALQ